MSDIILVIGAVLKSLPRPANFVKVCQKASKVHFKCQYMEWFCGIKIQNEMINRHYVFTETSLRIEGAHYPGGGVTQDIFG